MLVAAVQAKAGLPILVMGQVGTVTSDGATKSSPTY